MNLAHRAGDLADRRHRRIGLRLHHADPRDDGRYCVLMEAYGYRWYRLGGLGYILRRSDL